MTTTQKAKEAQGYQVKEYLTIPEYAKSIGKKREYIYKMIDQGRLKTEPREVKKIVPMIAKGTRISEPTGKRGRPTSTKTI